jgi:hypothetical protein
MVDGEHRRADSCNPDSDYMRHRVRRNWREWEKIGASVQTLQWIREDVSIPFKNNVPSPRFSKGVSLLDATLARIEFVNRELARFVQAGSSEPSTCDLRFHALPSAQTGRKLVATNLRPPPTQQVMRAKATQDGDAPGSKTPSPKWGLYVQL